MGIEERISCLENELQEAINRLAALEAEKAEQYLTVAGFAKRMDCAESTIYQHISNDTIKAVKIGGLVRIPMSQFALAEPTEKHKRKAQNKKRTDDSMKHIVFG